MTPEELSELFARESERVEWKQSGRDTNKIGPAVCAMANDLGNTKRPGYVVIGVNDAGKVVGALRAGENADKEQRSLLDRVFAKLLPQPSVNLEVVRRPEGEVWVLVVAPYDGGVAVHYDGKVCVRKGTSTRDANDADRRRLEERRPLRLLPFDSRPIEVAAIDDLDDGLRAQYASLRDDDPSADTFPAFEAWLKQRELGAYVEGVFRPNAAALLVYGNEPQRFFPGARIEFVRYGGTEIDAPVVSRKAIGGPLPTQLQTLWEQIKAHNVDVPVAPQGIQEAFRPAYPEEALREFARNLVQHRLYEGTNAPGRVEWYDDRIVFSNPGGPYGQASEGEFGAHSEYRNPTVTLHLFETGYVQRLGRGVRVARKHLEKNGNPPLQLENDGFTNVTVFGLAAGARP
ncbi:MAG TPA: RNA-binding domain-containing protein [Polyangiaceae bacterium]|nr:RNA-binding domain-containing protein [Polyangiaceae bacterium]